MFIVWKEVNITRMSWSRKDWWWLLGIMLLAACLRFYRLGELPPGFQFDEAFNAIDAQQVLLGNRPLFLPANAGREVLYTYWQAFLAALFGLNVYTLRLASALLGMFAIPATYLLLRGTLARANRNVAIGTTLVLAISLWHFHFSRYGIRVISMPVIFSGAFGLAWLGAFGVTRRTRLLAYIGCGLLTGLSVWTHPTGRFAPFVLILFTAYLLWRFPAWRTLRLDRPLGGLVLAGIIAFIVFLPLGLEFYRHPEFFFSHASEVSVFADRVSGGSPLQALLWNIGQVLGMFSFTGDREWTHGPAGRSVFDWPMALVFYLGVGLIASRLTVQRNDTADAPQRAALILFAIWAGVMLFPSILSDAAPNYSRTLPALPALLVPAGLGLARLADWRRPAPWVGPVAAGLIVVYSTGQAVYDYFVRFPQSPDVYYMYDADKLDALAYLDQFTDKNQVYLSQLWGDFHATVWFLRGPLGIKSLDTSDTVVLPPPGQGAVYAFPHEQRERAEQLAMLWPDLEAQPVDDAQGNVLLYTVSLDAETAAAWPPNYSPTIARTAGFVDAPTLLGMQAATPDKQISLFWRADTPMPRSLTTFIHLIDRDGTRVAQIDKLPGNGSYATPFWTVGERVIDRAYPTLLDPCAGGEPLRVRVGWYELANSAQQQPRADSAGTSALAGEIVLPLRSAPDDSFALGVQTDVAISPTLTLRGYSLHSEAYQAGSPLTIDLVWQSNHGDDARPPRTQPLTLLLRSDATEETLWQGPLAPNADWADGLSLCRRLRATLPIDAAPGTYQLALALGEASPIELQTIELGPSTRQYEVPELARPISATLTTDAGESIALLGVGELATEGSAADGTPQLAVTLVWQAQTRIDGNYSAFVHLLDASGTIISQSDAVPAGGYATNRWLPQEVVVDRHLIDLPADLPPGDYRLVAGLYDPIAMHRVRAQDVDGTALPDDLIPLGQVEWPLSP